MRSIEPKYHMDHVERNIEKLGQEKEDLTENFKSFM